jgi:pimeloyl-ACP methyl ester carboxylesterase
MGIYQMAKLGYQELCNAIIRPPRSNYPAEALGPEEFLFCGERFVRRDFGVVNERGLLLECSMWKKEVLGHEGGSGEGGGEDIGRNEWERQRQQQRRDQVNDADDSNDEIDHRCGQITLNVDDWDESKERGHLFLQVPESFEDSSTASSGWGVEEEEGEEDDDDEDGDTDESRDGFERDSPGRMTHPRDRRRKSTSCGPYYRRGVAIRKNHRRTPVVIYLHGNSSGRPEVVNTLGHLLSLGVAVVAFDFAGSGKSEGEFVSLGYYEQEDLHTVIHHLRASGEFSTIALWGRSMGAATAIMYGSRDATVSCMIIDSAFTDLTTLAEEMVDKVKEQGINVPNFIVSMTLRMIKSSIKSQAGFSIKHISPMSHVSRCLIPAMFVAGEHDGFINKQHSERLHARYAGDKNLIIVEGDHNSPRPRYLLQSACLFLQSCMQLSPSLELVVPMGTNLFLPPWFGEGEGGPRGEADRIKAQAMNRARAEAFALSDRRAWLSVNDNRETEPFPLQKQRSQPSSKDSSLQNDILLEKGQLRTRSCTPALRNVSLHPATNYSASLELPDMSKRQKDIQSSLFKMLGKNE